MDFIAERRNGLSRRGVALILLAAIAALVMALAAPAQASTPNVAQAWGQNGRGTLGDGFEGNEYNNAVPFGVKKLSGIAEIASERGSTFYGQALARLEAGAVWAWGRGVEGQVGDGTERDKDEPVAVCAVGETAPCANHLEGVKGVAAGANHSLAVLNSGGVVEWGTPGDGTKTDVPVAKSALSGVKEVAGGNGFSLALLAGGTVMAWGSNSSGDLGNGTETASAEPVAVCAVGQIAPCAKDLEHVKAISAANNHALALLEDGTVVAWGSNSNGELGNGTTIASDVPVVVCAVGATIPCSEASKQLKGATGVAAGQTIGVALLETGNVVDWGEGRAGALGNGTTTSSSTPVYVCAAGETAPCANHLSAVSAIAAGGEGGSAGYALLASGKVVDWGEGTWRELGDGSQANSDTPVYVCASGEVAPCARKLENVKGITAGDEQGFAFGPFPTVTAISPKEGSELGGTKVKITGTGFSGVTGVRFGATKAKSFSVKSETEIEAVSPAGSGSVFVVVSTPVDNTGANSADLFTYTPSPLPELGRCVKVNTGTGEYEGSHCQTSGASPAKRDHNWLPGPGPKPGFTGVLEGLTVGEAVKLQTANAAHLISCSNSEVKGQYTGVKSEKVKVELLGCTLSGKICTGEAGFQEGEIHFSAESSTLGFVRTGTKPVAGWDLKPISVEITCGRPPETSITRDKLEGSVIGKVGKASSMYLEFLETYNATAGKQKPEKLVNAPKDVLTSNFTELPSAAKSEEQTGLVARDKIVNSEPLEIRTKCVKEGAPCF
jgi:alpha-tubulin suppressor-like RCC1 family protein